MYDGTTLTIPVNEFYIEPVECNCDPEYTCSTTTSPEGSNVDLCSGANSGNWDADSLTFTFSETDYEIYLPGDYELTIIGKLGDVEVLQVIEFTFELTCSLAIVDTSPTTLADVAYYVGTVGVPIALSPQFAPIPADCEPTFTVTIPPTLDGILVWTEAT